MIERPNPAQIEEIAEGFGMHLTPGDTASFIRCMAGLEAAYARLDAMVEPRPTVKYARDPGRPPSGAENPHQAWTHRTEIRGNPRGRLSGKRVAIKDNICVAGIPMRNGSRVLEGYVPEIDATVVERILDAGGIIVGKTTCEDLCFSGASHTSKPQPVTNPCDRSRSAGGSSSGSAVVVACSEADMALGGDQGGSIRVPASWCGIYGLKPTHGLVPYTGIFPIEITLDHCGPMARTVEDLALLLAAIAGPDGLDPRQGGIRAGDYLDGLRAGVRGLRIAVVKEGFGRPESEAVVDTRVRSVASALEELGATITELTIPQHVDGLAIWNALIVEGATELMIKGNAFGTNWEGHYVTSLLEAFARGWRSRPDDLSETVKTGLLFGEYARRRYHGRHYAKAQNLRRSLRAAYDGVLVMHDLLLMPTIPFRATRLPAPDASREDYVARAFDMLGNTAPFDASGHPALSVPCGKVDGLPVGAMLIGRRLEEATLFRAAAALEGTHS
jgi:amidase